ncbi:BatD family protein [Hydrogenovibrio sp. 3SP14C1]|uniref:BatD family protein n=1 Tax=Hydrogenovibrio sp. 3SP14C1 TaxID=3038774 RepID=UPI002415A65C|nr:BatD family protein [Hydrogenovibrio sp. 3SP14C1]MDG4813549.1 BatD family protein [Hydrogenovibrio sp. 3SP14C1]
MYRNTKNQRWLTKLILITLALILVLLLSSQVFAKSVTVKVDHQQVEMGDIISVVIKTDFQTFKTPDFSGLKDQFDILGTQRSSQIEIINGNYQSYSRWDLRLTPKQVGDLVIPPIKVGGVMSEPHIIKVSQNTTLSGKTKGSSFLESSINLTKPYVQQEVLFTLRFYHLGQFINGNIRPPTFHQAITENIRNQFHYQKNVSGRLYDVYEWTWAFYPQKSGKMVIPPQSFNGRIQYRGQLKSVKDQTQPIELNILPKPTSYPKNTAWLPAKEITLTDDLQTQTSVRVGDSITRTLSLKAEGLLASQLPDFQFKDQAAFHIYPDQADNNNQKTEQGMLSQKHQKIAIVPTQEGSMTLPEITLTWWNTQTQKQETQTLPEKTITVLPAVSQQQDPFETMTPDQISQTPPSVDSANPVGLWQSVALIFGVLWIISSGLAIRFYRKRKGTTMAVLSSESQENSQAWQDNQPELEKLCQENKNGVKDARMIYPAILAWQQHNPTKYNEALKPHLYALKAHLYHQADLPADTLSALCDEIKHLNTQSTRAPKKAGKHLDPLYPNEVKS